MHIYETISAPFRVLPDFIIIGAQKSGTTSLYHYISQHPEVIPSFKKEANFFDSKYARGALWYRRYFPMKSEMKQGFITGEASPCYMLDPQVAGRIARILPDVKLIVLLRDPVYRCISSYHHSVRKGNEVRSLHDAISQEDADIAPVLEKSARGERLSLSESRFFRRRSYKRRGRYAEQLSIFFKHFRADQFYIESAERFFQHPESVVKEVFEFLGIDPDFTPADLKARNVNNYPDAPVEIINSLTEYYAPMNEDLFKLIGKRFDWRG